MSSCGGFFLIKHLGPFEDLAGFFSSSSVRSPAKISVLFLEDLDAALQRLTAASLAVGLPLKQSSPLPRHLQFRQISLTAFAEVLQHPEESPTARSFGEEILSKDLDDTSALSLEGVSQMGSILPERLLALVRPAFDLVLRRIRSLKRCVQACGCKIMTPRYAPQFGSRLHFKRANLCRAKKKTKKKKTRGPQKRGPRKRGKRGPGHAHRGSERGRLHPDPGGEPVEHRAHLQLDARARAALRLPLPARHGLQLRGVHVRGRQRLRPVVRQLRGRPGRLEHGQDVLHRAAKRSCEAALWGALPGAGPAQPNGRNGGRLRPLDPGRNFGGRQHGGGGHGGFSAAAEARVPRRRGRRRHATLGEVLLEPTLTTLGNFLARSSQSSVASASFTVGGFQLEGYAMTLSAFAWNIVRTYTLTPGRRYSFGCRYRLGTASNLVMYVSAADNDYVGVTGTFLGTPSQGVWSTARLDFSVPPGGIAKLHFGAFGGSIPGLVQQSAGTLDLYSMQIRASAFEGDSVSVTDLLADSLALTGSATLDGLTAQGNVGCDQLLCNDVNCTDVFTTGVDASGAISCAALTATGAVAGAALTSTGAVSGSSLSISGAAELRHGNHGQHSHHQQHGQRRELHHGGRRVHGHADGLGRSNRGELRSHRGAHGRHADHHRGGLRGPALDCTFTATSGGVSTGSVVCGDVTSSGTVSAPQLFASNTLTVTNTSDFSDDLFLTKNWAGWSKLQVSNNSAAPDSGPELRLLGNQSARVFLERDGGAHQCELIMINDEALVQTKSLSTQLSLTTNQRNPGCLVIAGNTGNVVCNTSFTDLSDSRVKTEIAEADVAELLQLFDSVEAKQYKRPDMNGDLRLGFASDDFAGTKWKNLTGTTRWSDGTEMVTLGYSHLTSVLWGVCKGFQARLDALEAWQAQRGPKNK